MSEHPVEIVEDDADLPGDVRRDIAALARRMVQAQGLGMRALNLVGNGIENRLERLPDRVKDALETGAGAVLERAYHAARRIGSHGAMPKVGPWAHHVAVAGSGAAGGIAGLPSALIEMPATVTLIFGALQKIAASYGFDPVAEETRLTCLEVFGSGGPGARDDGVNSSFLGARIGLNGTTLHAVIARVAPVFAASMGQKLAGQMIPILGAALGAGINVTYMHYYQDMAHVRFGLKRLAARHGEAAVLAAFRADVAAGSAKTRLKS